jgi:hypothetical protein
VSLLVFHHKTISYAYFVCLFLFFSFLVRNEGSILIISEYNICRKLTRMSYSYSNRQRHPHPSGRFCAGNSTNSSWLTTVKRRPRGWQCPYCTYTTTCPFFPLSRLQGGLQKSWETGAELHNLKGAMNDIHDTLGGSLVS